MSAPSDVGFTKERVKFPRWQALPAILHVRVDAASIDNTFSMQWQRHIKAELRRSILILKIWQL